MNKGKGKGSVITSKGCSLDASPEDLSDFSSTPRGPRGSSLDGVNKVETDPPPNIFNKTINLFKPKPAKPTDQSEKQVTKNNDIESNKKVVQKKQGPEVIAEETSVDEPTSKVGMIKEGFKELAITFRSEVVDITKTAVSDVTEFVKEEPKKSMIGGGVLFVILVAFITCLALLLPSGQDSKKRDYTPTTVYPSNETMILGAGDYYISSTFGSGGLYKLTKVFSNGDTTVVGRSFDGYNWDSMASTSMDFDCDVVDGFCAVTIPSAGGDGSYYQVVSIGTKTFKTDDKSIAATFLMQATFGQTRATITNFLSNHTFSSWVTAQMEEPMWSHREYFRKRANTRLDVATVVGGIRMPCEDESRWHRFAFTDHDVGKTVVVTELSSTMLTFSIDDITITDISKSEYNATLYGWTFDICEVEELLGGGVTVGAGDDCDVDFENPLLRISSLQLAHTLINSTYYDSFTELSDVADIFLFKGDGAADMSTCDASIGTPLFASTAYGVLKYDPRVITLENTVESPIDFSTSSLQECPSVAKTFLNIDGCIADRETCSPILYSSADFQLNETMIGYFFSIAGRYVYYVSGLRPADDDIPTPCDGDTSRWVYRKNATDACDTTFTNQTVKNMIVNALSSVATDSSRVREITVLCDDSSDALIGAKVLVGSECWEHAHPEEFNVYDFSIWTRAHPGGSVHIEQFAVDGEPKLNFPSWHAMSRWATGLKELTLLGNLGDIIDFRDLASSLQQVDFAEMIGAVGARSADGFEVCGSPGEVANDPTLGNMYRFLIGDDSQSYTQVLDQAEDPSFVYQKSVLWNSVSFKAADQLRQRVAWALSQIFIITQDGANLAANVEVFGAYYDIFVRNAFGNYRDIMREVSFSPAMGRMLTYHNNIAFENYEQYPDENYAREIMQLFSIGLYQLHMNGTHKLDDNGNSIATYTNDYILSFARAWTGFTLQATRGNIESRDISNYNNYIDPMKLYANWRDVYPKKDLYDGFIGDGYPQCSTRPSSQFLKKGAVFRYRGQNPLPELIDDPSAYSNDNDRSIVRFNLNKSTSELYAYLCNGTTTSDHNDDDAQDEKCNFKSQVILDVNLECDAMECDVDTVRMVRMNYTNNGSTVPVYYEYVQSACVGLAFYENATTISKIQGSAGNSQPTCAEKGSLEAQATCCTTTSTNYATVVCAYYGERVTYYSAEAKCAALGKEVCKFRRSYDADCIDDVYLWSNWNCSTKAQIDADGLISIVHDSEIPYDTEMPLDNGMYIQVSWQDGNYPSVAADGCLGCSTVGETCYCNTEIVSSPVFTTEVPTQGEVKSYLHVGAFDPSTYDSGEFNECTQLTTSNVSVYIPSSSSYSICSSANFYLDRDVVFEIKDQLNRSLFYLNLESTVKVAFGQYEFRNPPQMMSARDRTARDAHHETEAVLDHYIGHPNTPPFVAYRMIQRFVTSNPSPRYIEVVATAFASGKYDTFGTGERGDMAATIAAVLLDREARSPTLLHDPTHGLIREPIVKLLHVLRALEYKHAPLHSELDLRTESSFGQMPFRAPNIFSFFLPDYQPPGPVASAGYVSPEAQLLTAPYIVGFINGMMSLIKWGLNDCYQGFALLNGNGCSLSKLEDYDQKTWAGNLTYTPTEDLSTTAEVIAELDILLTGGRMNAEGLETIEYAYDHGMSSGDNFDALQAAEQLFIMTPEFHVTNVNKPTEESRVGAENDTVSQAPEDYKAIVYLYFGGALDSYNLIVPHSHCGDGDLYEEYATVRDVGALSKSALLPIQVPNGTQPCDTFGIHPSLDILQELYQDGESLWVANIGPLVETITKQEYEDKTKETPPSLFSHNKMELATHTVHAELLDTAKGVIGRVMDALTDQGYSTGSYSINGNVKVLEPVTSDNYDVVDRNNGVTVLDSSDSSQSTIKLMKNLTTSISESIYAETWKQQLWSAMERTEALDAVLSGVELDQVWAADDTSVGTQFEQISYIIKANQHTIHNERDAFYVYLGGFDTHADLFDTLAEKMDDVNTALTSFVEEMKLQGMWGNVTVVAASEFGRTLTTNGVGTDHAWGGNTFMLGGNMCGGQILGDYPTDLTEDGDQNIGRGRMIPTTSWEAIWYGISGWLGADESQMDTILPHFKNFADDEVYSKYEMFDLDGCGVVSKKKKSSQEEALSEASIALIASASVLFFFMLVFGAVFLYYKFVLKQPLPEISTLPGYARVSKMKRPIVPALSTLPGYTRAARFIPSGKTTPEVPVAKVVDSKRAASSDTGGDVKKKHLFRRPLSLDRVMGKKMGDEATGQKKETTL